jgi:hypothetical protein
MLPGFNTNVSCRQQAFHVQTEDVIGDDPHILTLVFRGGAVIARIKTSYRDLLGANPSPGAVRSLMTRQHRQTIADIQAGKIDGEQGP